MPGALTWVIETSDLTTRNHNKILNTVLRERGHFHKDQRIPRHFARNSDSAPGGPWGYARRSKRTVTRKIRAGKDGARPNVFTGEMLSIITATGRVTATKDKWTYRAIGTITRPLPDWQRKEIEAIAPHEVADDVRVIGRRYSEMAAMPEFQRKRRRRIGAST